MVNALTGSRMWVAEDRVEEYVAAGHKLAAVPVTEKKTTAKPKAKAKKAKK